MSSARSASSGDDESNQERHGLHDGRRDDDLYSDGHDYDDESYSDIPSARSCSSDDQSEEGTRRRTINDDLEEDVIEKLQLLCYVLDINFGLKLNELDATPGELSPDARSRVVKSIRTLVLTKKRRFRQLKKLGEELIGIWKTNHIPLSKGINLVVVYAVVDAKSADAIIGEKFLSSSLIKKVGAEVDRLKSAIKKRIKTKYLARQKKVKDLLSDGQLIPSDVGLEPDEIVGTENYHTAAKGMKVVIKDLKKKVLKRRELIIIVQSVEVAVEQLWPLDITQALLDKAKKEVEKMKADSVERTVVYKGQDISVLLDRFLTVALTLHDEASEDQTQNSLGVSMTRSGTRFKTQSPDQVVHVRQQTQTENSLTQNLAEVADWMMTDKKRILNATYRVRNLENAIEMCTKGFGMKVFRRIDGTGNHCSEVLLGFGSENENFALRLIHLDHGATEGGFGHVVVSVNDMCKVIRKVKGLSGCRIIHEPSSFQGGSYTIAYTQDINGTLFELIQRRPRSEMLCGVMLYITDLDKSINFYAEVLGMQVIKRKSSTCILGYGEGDNKATFLELRVNAECIKGHAYTKLIIGTDDIRKTIAAMDLVCTDFGGVLQKPRGSRSSIKTVSVLDPDGWKTVLVERNVRGGYPDSGTESTT